MPMVLAIGELLWDHLPGGSRFGGAPANFACAVAGLSRAGIQSWLASAIGDDTLGADAVRELTAHGVETSLIQSNDKPTGQVFVNLDQHGQASYRFLEGAAWDHLAFSPELRNAARRADAICFGTLGQRSAASRETIRLTLNEAQSGCLKVLDVNLRAPYWSPVLILDSLAQANVLKLNDEELPVLSGLLALSGSERERLAAIRKRYSLHAIALTRGANGSILLRASSEWSERPGEAVRVADTIGAGDAFAAAMAIGLLSSEPLSAIHCLACDAAAFVCTQSGATPIFPERLRRN
jgi:fructokinase